MITKKISILFLAFVILSNCSFDSKTGIWGDSAKEKKKIADLENKQKEIIKVQKIYSSDFFFSKEVSLSKSISLSKPENNSSWVMPNLNYQNFLGNLYLSGIDNTFLKKKIGKDKFELFQSITPILIVESNIIFSDDNGTIFKINDMAELSGKKTYTKNPIKRFIRI